MRRRLRLDRIEIAFLIPGLVTMATSMKMLICLFIVATGLLLWFATRKLVTRAEPRQKYLARLLLVCGRAFYDRNEELYLATIREIINIMRAESWQRAEVEWKIRRALSLASVMSSPDNYEKACRLAQNINRANV